MTYTREVFKPNVPVVSFLAGARGCYTIDNHLVIPAPGLTISHHDLIPDLGTETHHHGHGAL